MANNDEAENDHYSFAFEEEDIVRSLIKFNT